MSSQPASDLRAVRSSYGDVRFSFRPGQNAAEGGYHIDVLDPEGRKILRTLEVTEPPRDDGLITVDYPVGDASEDFGFPPTWLAWQVRAGKEAPVKAAGDVVLDNPAIIRKMVVLGINSLVGGYFNDLSDPSNPGGTGAEGRRDLVAAATFRRRYAELAGLKEVEVLPLMTVVGSSPINPMPYQKGFDPNNYWWNPDRNEPGPNLLMADRIVRETGMAPAYFVESGPGETTGIMHAPKEMRPAILEAWRKSNIAMLKWMREHWGNPDLEIWFQGATSSFWGEDIPPTEVNAEGAQLLRDLQTRMALEDEGFKMGSYVPRAHDWQTYANEMELGVGWIHYTVDGYHDAAREMAESMARNRNMALDPPEWTTLRVVEDIHGAKQANGDNRVEWKPRPGAKGWWYVNKRADTKEVISSGVLSVPHFIFTADEQVREYGGQGSYMVMEIGEYSPSSNIRGPGTMFEGTVE